jgi:hypothetical protein
LVEATSVSEAAYSFRMLVPDITSQKTIIFIFMIFMCASKFYKVPIRFV